jgi:DNA polymerase-3 subunit alpha
VVTKLQRQISRRDNSEWGKITVEDFHGTATVLAFKDNWQRYKETLQQDAVVLISGKVSGRERDEEDPPIFLDEAVLLEGVPNSGQLALQIELPIDAELDSDIFARAKRILVAHPGTAPVELILGTDNGAAAPVLRSRTLRADASPDTIEALQEMFGKARVRLVRVADGSGVTNPQSY